jgi:hypothetical protein
MTIRVANALLWMAALGAQSSQQGDAVKGLESVVRSEDADAAARVRALSDLQSRNDLDSGVLADALQSSSSHVAACAAAILRHEWTEWPSEVFDAITASPSALRHVLLELALAPRPSLSAFVQRHLSHQDATIRALAIAAHDAAPDRAQAAFLLETALSSDDRTVDLAIARIPSDVADRLVTSLHEGLLTGVDASRAESFFARLSDAGANQLMGIASTLPDAQRSRVHDFLGQRKPAALMAAMRAMLDGEIPIDALLLRRCGEVADTPRRREFLGNVIADALAASGDERKQVLALVAFDAAVDARIVDGPVLQFARQDPQRRMTRLATGRLELTPFGADWDAEIGEGSDADALRLAQILLRCTNALPRELELHVRRVVADGSDFGRMPGALLDAIALLARYGDEDSVRAAQKSAMGDRRLIAAFAHACLLRKDPIGDLIVESMLADETASGDTEQIPVILELLLLRAEQGAISPDDARFDGLFLQLGSLPRAEIERMRSAFSQLSDARWQRVIDAMSLATESKAKLQLGSWLLACPLERALPALRAQRDAATEPEDRLEWSEILLRTKDRAELLEAGKKAFGQNADADDDFVFAALGTMAMPLADADLAFLDWVMLTAPRLDPRESSRAREDRVRGAFPESSAVSNVMLRDPDNAKRALLRCGELASARDTKGLSRRRFVDLWNGLQRNAELLDAVGQQTAALVLCIADDSGLGLAAASLYAARSNEARGDHAAAEPLLRAAIAGFLRDPEAEAEARIHIGVRAPMEGTDPYAALAAAPFLARAHAAGDPAATKAAALLALEFAGRDEAARAEAIAILKTLR